MSKKEGDIEVPAKHKVRVNYARLGTAALIGTVILTSIYFGNNGIFACLVLITILGASEISRILQSGKSDLDIYLHIFLAALPFMYFRMFQIGDEGYLLLVVASSLIMSALILNLWFGKLNYQKWKYLFTLLYWALPFGLAGYFLLNSGINAQLSFLGIMLILWTSDSMAYFSGKLFGKRKLFPSVSPGKTKEGSLGAGIFSLIMAYAFATITEQDMLKWIVIGLIVWVIGTLGDLVESKFKRVQNVKDTSNILPGHGGLLDRFDSLVAILPFLLLLELLFRT